MQLHTLTGSGKSVHISVTQYREDQGAYGNYRVRLPFSFVHYTFKEERWGCLCACKVSQSMLML